MAGISAYNSPADNTSYLQKILNAKGEVHVNLPPGSIVQLYRTLIIGSDTHLIIPAGVTLQGSLGIGSLLVNYAQRLTPIACTASYTNGNDFFVVTSAGHGLLIGDSVAVANATLPYFNGVFRSIAVTINTFTLQLIADLNITSGSIGGSLTYKKADQNVRVTGGIFDFYKRNGNTGNIFTFDAVDGLFVSDISIIDSDNEPIHISSANNADINNVNSLLRNQNIVYKAGSAITNYKNDFVMVLSTYNFGAFCDGIHDDTLAIKKAVSYAKSIASNGVAVTLQFPGNHLLSDTIIFDSKQCNYIFDGSLIAGATFPVNNYMVQVQQNNCTIQNIRIEGTNLANGIFVNSSDTKILLPRLNHFTQYGIYFGDNASNSVAVDPTINQWLQSDAEFEVDANFTAHGIHFAYSDCRVLGGKVGWCGVSIYVEASVTMTYVQGCHIISGRPTSHSGGPFVDASLVHVEKGSISTQFHGCYFDNGCLNLYSPSVVLHDCNFILYETLATLTNSTIINVFANNTGAPVSLDLESIHIRTIPATYKLIDFFSFGAWSWTGDYSGISIPLNESVKTNRGTYIISNDNAFGIPYEFVYKPAGKIVYKKKIATNTEITETYDGKDFAITADSFRIQSTDQTVVDAILYLGNDSTSIRHQDNGPVTFSSNATDVFVMSGAALRPAADDTFNLGASTFTWKNIYGGVLHLSKTVTPSGTTGNQTINMSSGTVYFAAADTSLVVTNSIVTLNSIIQLTVGTNDTTMKSALAVAAAGSFTIFPNAVPTGMTRVNFTITN